VGRLKFRDLPSIRALAPARVLENRQTRTKARLGRSFALPSFVLKYLPLLLFLLSAPVSSQDAQLPLVVRCGRTGDPSEHSEPKDSWGVVVPDRVFQPQGEYGYVGGHPGKTERALVCGGEPEWPTTWREDAQRYVFRLPRGEYLVDLAFLETEVGAADLRVFDVYAEDEMVAPALDIFSEVGDFTWLTRSVVAKVYDGWLDVRLVPLTNDRPARISRIGIRRYTGADGAPGSPPAPSLQGRAGLFENVLWWASAASPGVDGYRVSRSESPDGLFQVLNDVPVRALQWVDRELGPQATYYYTLRAYGADGSESPASEVLKLSRDRVPPRWKQYDVRILPDDWKKLAVRSSLGVRVPGEIWYQNRDFLAEFFFDASPASWQLRKSLVVDMSRDPYRIFGKRRTIGFEAESGDFTQMREKLSAEALEKLGLAGPFVDPVTVLLNGRFWGQRFDLELLGDRFRRRCRLDREGVLVHMHTADRWRRSWEPYGDRVGRKGDIAGLNYLVRELHRVHEGEIAAFFERRFYLDRFIDRLALGAVRGEIDAPPESYYLLKDSRNGKWEFFRQKHDHGDWGVVDFSTELLDWTPEQVDRVLFPRAQRAGRVARVDWMVLFSRFFNVESLRRRYLDRVEELMEKPFSPPAFDELVDRTFAAVREAISEERNVWPFDHGASFAKAPVKLKDAHRRRLSALRGRIAKERARVPEAVVIEEFLVDPREGKPWVLVKNRSESNADISKYFLAESLATPRASAPERTGSVRTPLGEGALGPGESVRLDLPSRGRAVPARTQAIRRAGGVFSLWRQVESSRPILADFVFYGRQTPAVSYRRLDGNEWAFFDRATDGEPAKPRAGPSYEYLQGLEESSSGDLTIWFRPQGGSRAKESISKVLLKFRAEDRGSRSAEFSEVELRWDESRFRYSTGLGKDDRRPRTAYYFLVRAQEGVERTYPLGAPGLTYYIPVHLPIFINELCPRPDRTPDSPGEFVELYNASDRSVSLRGMYLTDSRRLTTKWRITEDLVIRPRGYVVLYADGLNRDDHMSFKLRNSGEFVGLYGPVSDGNLLVDRVAFHGVPPGRSWGRKQDGTKGFQVWKDPTPGKRNMPKIPEEFLKGR